MEAVKSSAVSKTAEYAAWNKMKKQCRKTGVTICEEWGTFEVFLREMGEKPSPDASLIRVDRSKGYSADNCRWADRTERENNKGNNHMLTFDDKTQSLAMWAEDKGIDYKTLWDRVVRQGWSAEKALTIPVEARFFG